MDSWRKQLRLDPLPELLASDNDAVRYYARRDLLGEDVGPVQQLWPLREPQRLLRKQQADGSWPRSGVQKHPAINYSLIETWRQLRVLVDMYGFTRENPGVHRAAEYLFSCQTQDGDIRGMLANQYATYYTGAIIAHLIRAGYSDDPRIEKGFQWLLAMRQDDQGWTIPLITHKLDRETQYRLTSEVAEPLEPDRSKPFSHNWTGMVLRAFASHEQHRKSEAALTAAHLLASRFFLPDAYTSYQAASYWVRFQYPFWWNNLIAALDSVSLIGLMKDDPQIQRALAWLVEHQEDSGLWKTTYAKAEERETAKTRETRLWVTLAICRVFKRLYAGTS